MYLSLIFHLHHKVRLIQASKCTVAKSINKSLKYRIHHINVGSQPCQYVESGKFCVIFSCDVYLAPWPHPDWLYC
jgi:hypothetical protein